MKRIVPKNRGRLMMNETTFFGNKRIVYTEQELSAADDCEIFHK